MEGRQPHTTVLIKDTLSTLRSRKMVETKLVRITELARTNPINQNASNKQLKFLNIGYKILGVSREI